MVFAEVFDSFINQSPVSVMFRGTLERVFASDRLDKLFAEAMEKQRVGDWGSLARRRRLEKVLPPFSFQLARRIRLPSLKTLFQIAVRLPKLLRCLV